MLFRSVFWFPLVLNDPCDHRYVLYTLGEGPGNLWEASGLPPQPPGVIAGGVRLVSLSAVYSPANYCEETASACHYPAPIPHYQQTMTHTLGTVMGDGIYRV